MLSSLYHKNHQNNYTKLKKKRRHRISKLEQALSCIIKIRLIKKTITILFKRKCKLLQARY